MIHILSNLIRQTFTVRKGTLRGTRIFDSIAGYEGIKRTFTRSLNSHEPVHILLVGPPGQAKTMFLKCVLKAFGERGGWRI
jgi:predicted ATPase with chaperone activity